ncbi:hypothetical protein [uncultured Methanobrevibacter sp.]|uniref:hypothetical protein n=1 Tax=uncultured Methanobrevibacter sp. TaxID=253161 RepID=UPI0026381749|nr:hypothetical protein [uncultured Methanobrevibacter sp.]
MSQMIERYKKEYHVGNWQLQDRLTNKTIVKTNLEAEIAEKIIDYAYNECNKHERKQKLIPYSREEGTLVGIAIDENTGDKVKISANNKLISVNDKTPSEEQEKYYKEVYGLDTVKPKRHKLF